MKKHVLILLLFSMQCMYGMHFNDQSMDVEDLYSNVDTVMLMQDNLKNELGCKFSIRKQNNETRLARDADINRNQERTDMDVCVGSKRKASAIGITQKKHSEISNGVSREIIGGVSFEGLSSSNSMPMSAIKLVIALENSEKSSHLAGTSNQNFGGSNYTAKNYASPSKMETSQSVQSSGANNVLIKNNLASNLSIHISNETAGSWDEEYD